MTTTIVTITDNNSDGLLSVTLGGYGVAADIITGVTPWFADAPAEYESEVADNIAGLANAIATGNPFDEYAAYLDLNVNYTSN